MSQKLDDFSSLVAMIATTFNATLITEEDLAQDRREHLENATELERQRMQRLAELHLGYYTALREGLRECGSSVERARLLKGLELDLKGDVAALNQEFYDDAHCDDGKEDDTDLLDDGPFYDDDDDDEPFFVAPTLIV